MSPTTARLLAALLVGALFVLPLLAALGHGLADALDATAWAALLEEPALPRALALSLVTAVLATGLALAALLCSLPALHGTPAWGWLQRALGPLLAVPHAAFAIGVALWIMPSGVLARLLALPLGWTTPPDVATVQDPWGLGLALALAAKEWPFLLWCSAAQLGRADLGPRLRQQLGAGRSLGYATPTLWWRVVWPQLLPRLAWPLAAVWAYALTVVDMALVLGPARPPTLAMLAWGWLQGADPTDQRQGSAAALLLALVMAAGMALAVLAWRTAASALARRAIRGDRPQRRQPGRASMAAVLLLSLGNGLVLVVLALASVLPAWPFPALWPAATGWQAWQLALGSSGAMGHTLGLGLASAATGLLLALAWLEASPPHWDRHATVLVFLPLWWPGMLMAAGLYSALLPWRLDGSWLGVWLGHGLYTAPYAVVALAPAHRAFDPRYRQVTQSLGRSGASFLWRVKWPMLAGPLAAAFAVAFAVSVAQYLSTQLVGAGRWPTLSTEALNLAGGGQRDRVAAFALLQALLPAVVFAMAAGIGSWQARQTGAAAGMQQ